MTKCVFHADLFTAIFLISVASSAFSTGRKWDEIFCLYDLVGAFGGSDGLTLDSFNTKRLMGSSIGMWKQRPAVRESCRGLLLS